MLFKCSVHFIAWKPILYLLGEEVQVHDHVVLKVLPHGQVPHHRDAVLGQLSSAGKCVKSSLLRCKNGFIWGRTIEQPNQIMAKLWRVLLNWCSIIEALFYIKIYIWQDIYA